MRKKFLISTLLSVSMIVSSLSGIPRTVSAADQQIAQIATQADPAASELPPEENDPGYERLSGAYEPAAEKISAEIQKMKRILSAPDPPARQIPPDFYR